MKEQEKLTQRLQTILTESEEKILTDAINLKLKKKIKATMSSEIRERINFNKK